ncbi:MAG: hypothetical protein Q9212_004003 [Teloschistes hypoglaucus]
MATGTATNICLRRTQQPQIIKRFALVSGSNAIDFPKIAGINFERLMAELAIGAIVVTVPSAAYLIYPVYNKKGGHGHGGGGHGKHEGGGEHGGSSEESHQSESEQKEGNQTAETASSDGDSNERGEDGGSAESDTSGPTRPDHSVEDAGQGTPDTSSDEDPKAGSYELPSGSNVEGVRFKGATSGGTREGEQGDTRKHIPDAKGGAKHRIESHYAKELGSLKEDDPGDSDKVSLLQALASNNNVDYFPACGIQIDELARLDDFIDYLAYVTNDAERLQFYLWLVDYHQRFRNAPSEETALSPKWNFDDPHSSPRNSGNSGYSNVPCSDKTLSVLGINDFDAIEEEDISNASLLEDRPSPYTAALGTLKFSELPLNEAKPLEGSNRRSASTQPFRVEINRIITHYIAPGSPRELNLSHKDRAAVLYALRRTTHPSAFLPIKKVLDMTLRNQSHPNFVRWSICNGNKPWTIFLRTFAACNIAIGFAIAILLTLSHASRWYRILAALEWWFGITNLIAAYQGLCVLLLRRHTREVRPWEIDEQGRRYGSSDEEVGLRHSKILYEQTKSRWPVKMELFGPPNTWDHKNWMDRYSVKSILKKTFEKEVPTQEHGLHFMQNKIVRQAEAWALIITIPLTIFFTALPKGNLY